MCLQNVRRLHTGQCKVGYAVSSIHAGLYTKNVSQVRLLPLGIAVEILCLPSAKIATKARPGGEQPI